MNSILGIGNSFSDDSFEFLSKILSDVGKRDCCIGNLYIGGCSLETHYNNLINDYDAYEYRMWDDGFSNTFPTKISKIIKSYKWDYVSLQQCSPLSGLCDKYTCLDELINCVNKLKDKNTKFVWNMTWAYKNGISNPAFAAYDHNQIKMYNMICDTVNKLIVPKKDLFKIVPVGTAIQNARTSKVGDNLTRDGAHLSFDLGRYIASLTFAVKVFDVDLNKVNFVPDGVDEYRKAVAFECVENAINNPFEITNSKV